MPASTKTVLDSLREAAVSRDHFGCQALFAIAADEIERLDREVENVGKGQARAEANEKELHAENLRFRTLLAELPHPERLEKMLSDVKASGTLEMARKSTGRMADLPAILEWMEKVAAMHKEIVGDN